MAGLIPEVAVFDGGGYLVDAIPVSEWDAVVERFTHNRPLQVKVLGEAVHRHPWRMTLAWDTASGKWGVKVNAGFVNEDEVVMRVSALDVGLRTFDRLDLNGGEERVEAWLSEDPCLKIEEATWRVLGSDAAALAEVEAVPEFFIDLGVEPLATKVDTSGGQVEVKVSGAVADLSERRLLRAVDVVLNQPRPALTADWFDSGDGLGSVFQMGFKVPAADAVPAVSVRTRYVVADGGDLGGLLPGGFIDQAFDELKLATLYLVSPAGAVSGSEPDETWAPYVKHSVFWNLRYGINQELGLVEQQSLSFPVPLAGGVGNAAIQGVLDVVNDANNRAAVLLKQVRIEGRFWT